MRLSISSKELWISWGLISEIFLRFSWWIERISWGCEAERLVGGAGERVSWGISGNSEGDDEYIELSRVSTSIWDFSLIESDKTGPEFGTDRFNCICWANRLGFFF